MKHRSPTHKFRIEQSYLWCIDSNINHLSSAMYLTKFREEFTFFNEFHFVFSLILRNSTSQLCVWRVEDSDTTSEYSHTKNGISIWFVSARSERTTERSYRMCYLNHTNQTLYKFYYFVLLLRVLILLNYFISMSRNVAVAADAACCCCHYCLLLRLLVPFDDWSTGEETTSTTAATRQFEIVLLSAFLVFRCVCSVLSYHQLGVFGDAMFQHDFRSSDLLSIEERQHNIATCNENERDSVICLADFVRVYVCVSDCVDCFMPNVWTTTKTVHVVFLLCKRHNRLRFLSFDWLYSYMMRAHWSRTEAICARTLKYGYNLTVSVTATKEYAPIVYKKKTTTSTE